MNEYLLVAILRGERKGWFYSLIRLILFPLSLGFAAIATCRSLAYDWGILKQYRVEAQVISVGNITVGGTGKTPLTLLLAEALQDVRRLAILSRGYRSSSEKKDQVQLVDYQTDATICGDEPALLARRLSHTHCFVGKNRLQAAHKAVESGCDLLILDDGMQHRCLYRDADIVVINGNEPFGLDYFLPRGFLRESPRALKRASLIILNHSSSEKVIAKIRLYSQAPIVHTRMILQNIEPLQKEVLAVFCAIGQPQMFIRSLQQQGCKIVNTLFLSDHAAITFDQVHDFAEKSQKLGATCLVCTEKDSVKLAAENTLKIPIIPILARLEIVDGLEDWNAFLSEYSVAYSK